MTPDEMRIAIAEVCGYKKVECPLSSLGGGSPCKPKPMTYWADECWGGDTIGLPDYLNDLNACAEMVKSLSIGQRSVWPMHLREIVARDGKGQENPDTGLLDDTHFYNATAPQRCEAFLRTLGLWKETPSAV